MPLPTLDPTLRDTSAALATLASLEVLDTAYPLLCGVATCLSALALSAARAQVQMPEIADACTLLAAELATVQRLLARWADTRPCACPTTPEDTPWTAH